MYVSKNLILNVYVNNILIISKKKILINTFIKSLLDREENFELTDEDSINKYLGIEMNK